MEQEFWQKQTDGKPLFPDMLWSRPENKFQAGKLLIIGGNLHGFAAPAEAYHAAEKAGVGTSRVILPLAVKKIVGHILENGEFAASNPSGSFAQQALSEFLDHALWADGVLFAGDLGRNSETAIVIEKFTGRYSSPLVLTKGAVDYYVQFSKQLEDKRNHLLVITIAQLQRLAINHRFTTAFTYQMTLQQLIQALHQFSLQNNIYLVTKYHDNILVVVNGKVAIHKLNSNKEAWRVATAAAAATWWLQNPQQPFKAITTAVYEAFSS